MEKSFIKQQQEKDCGIAVTTMVVNYLQKKQYSLQELKFENNLGDTELSFYNIGNICEKYFIDFESYTCDYTDFAEFESKFPFVMSVKNELSQDHFILVYQKRRHKILVADPSSSSIRWMEVSDFIDAFNGYIGVFRKELQIKFEKKSIFNWTKFIASKGQLYIVYALAIFFNVLILISNTFLRVYFQTFKNENMSEMNKIFIAFGLLLVLQLVIDFLIKWMINRMSVSLREEMFKKFKTNFLQLEYEQFQTIDKQKWLSYITDIYIIEEYIMRVFVKMPISLMLFMLSSIIIIINSPIIFLILILESILLCLCGYGFAGVVKNQKYACRVKGGVFNSNMQDMINGFESVQNKQMHDHINVSVSHRFSELENAQTSLANLNTIQNHFKTFVIKIFYFLVFYVSIYSLRSGEISLGYIIFYSSIYMYINNFALDLTNCISDRQLFNNASDNLFLLFKPNEILNKQSINEITSFKFKDVHKYINQNKLCNNINLKINGSSQIYGVTGIGKSTILKFMAGLYTEYDGEILVNDANYKKLNLKELRNKTIYISGDEYLFYGDVWSNLQNFQNKIDINKFDHYNVFGILEKNKIDVSRQIYNNGYTFTKSQKQVINFLSMIFCEKDVYILDNALSDVDSDTKETLYQILFNVHINKMIIVCDSEKLKGYDLEMVEIN